jgi:hypothetical protein
VQLDHSKNHGSRLKSRPEHFKGGRRPAAPFFCSDARVPSATTPDFYTATGRLVGGQVLYDAKLLASPRLVDEHRLSTCLGKSDSASMRTHPRREEEDPELDDALMTFETPSG